MALDLVSVLGERVALTHRWLIEAGTGLQPEQFAHVFSQDAPPIGWHLWHITRFADRLQARLAAVTDGAVVHEEWQRTQLTARWGLTGLDTGVHETGMGQPHAYAVELVSRAGQGAIVQYAQVVFDAFPPLLQKLTAEQLTQPYLGYTDYETDRQSGRVRATAPRESLVLQDLVMHISHCGRHLGAMEGLRGLLGSVGTISV